MESNIKELEGCMRELEITLSEDEVQPRYQEAYKQAQMSINMPGFRPGRVPVKMIKKRFGAQIEMEADQEIINEIFPKIAEEKQLSIVGQPQLVNIDKESGGGVKFTIRFETIPEINLGDYKGLVVDEPVHTVEDEEIEKEIQGFRLNNAKEEHAEKVEEGDYKVDLIMNEIDEETGMPLVGSKENNITVLTSDNRWPEEMLKNLEGAESGKEFDYSPPNAEKPVRFKARVDHIHKLILPELDEEFISEQTGGKFDNYDDFKEEIGFQIQEQWDQRSRRHVENQIIDKMVEMHPDVSLPEPAVKEAMKNMLEDMKQQYGIKGDNPEFSVEKFEGHLRPLAERNVRWELIRNAIIEQEGLQVEEHDIELFAEQQAAAYNADKEAIKQQLIDNPQFTAGILAKKAMDLIFDFTTTNEVSFEEFEQNMTKPEDFYNDEDEFEDDDESSLPDDFEEDEDYDEEDLDYEEEDNDIEDDDFEVEDDDFEEEDIEDEEFETDDNAEPENYKKDS